MPLAPRAAVVQDILRLGIAQLLFLRTPPHAAVATSVDIAQSCGFVSHKGLVNAVLRRLSVEGAGRVEEQDAPRLNTPDWLWRSWSRTYGESTARAIAAAHLKEAPLDLTLRDDAETWCAALDGVLLPTGTLRRAAGGALATLPGYAEGAWWVQDAAAALPARLFGEAMACWPGGRSAQSEPAVVAEVAPAAATRRDGGRPLDPPSRPTGLQSPAARPPGRSRRSRCVDLASAAPGRGGAARRAVQHDRRDPPPP